MLEKIQSVIFDLDGTLVDSMWLWHDIDVEFLEFYRDGSLYQRSISSFGKRRRAERNMEPDGN